MRGTSAASSGHWRLRSQVLRVVPHGSAAISALISHSGGTGEINSARGGSCASLSAATCESLASLSLPSTTITGAESRPAGEFARTNGEPLGNLPAFCRVAGVIRPSSDSYIRFEVRLPAVGWNGKFQGAGNRSFAGSINFAVLGDAVRHNYASASTDTGHTDNSGTSAAWALNHPEKVVDYGYRAIHLTAINAKAISAAFYGRGPEHSYFNSCSNGGREGLIEAQRYPADYDGIIAGAPANDGTGFNSVAAFVGRSLLADPASYIPAAKLPAIEAAALAQCDAKDGVKDGVIENPLACPFDPSVLLCKDRESDSLPPQRHNSPRWMRSTAGYATQKVMR